jgi:general secretion pathway protein G
MRRARDEIKVPSGPLVVSNVQQSRIPESRRDDGFTLIELLIVIVVLGILAAIVVYAVGSARSDSVASSCKADVKTINTASEAYNVKNGSYASSIAALKASNFIKDLPANREYTLTYDRVTGTVSGCSFAGSVAPPTTTTITVLGCNPTSLAHSPGQQILTVSGTGFNAVDADVSIPGLSSASVETRTATTLTVSLAVPAGPVAGQKDVTVSSLSDGLSGTKVACFEVT